MENHVKAPSLMKCRIEVPLRSIFSFKNDLGSDGPNDPCWWWKKKNWQNRKPWTENKTPASSPKCSRPVFAQAPPRPAVLSSLPEPARFYAQAALWWTLSCAQTPSVPSLAGRAAGRQLPKITSLPRGSASPVMPECACPASWDQPAGAVQLQSSHGVRQGRVFELHWRLPSSSAQSSFSSYRYSS